MQRIAYSRTSTYVCPVPVSPLDVALARRFVFVGFENDLIPRFAQRRRLWRTQVEINVAVTSGIVVSYSDLLVENCQLKEGISHTTTPKKPAKV